MNIFPKVSTLFAALFMAAAFILSSSAYSASGGVRIVEERLELTRSKLQRVEEELQYVQYKRETTQQKLDDYQQNLREKEDGLILLKAKAAEVPSFENEQSLRNEERRIELAGITIKSRVASVVRLENKEQELLAEVESLQAKIAKDEKRLSIVQVEQRAEQKTDDLRRKLKALERENAGLRQQKTAAMAEIDRRNAKEAQRRKEAKRLAAQRAEKEKAAREAALAAPREPNIIEKQAAEASRLAQQEESLKLELEKQRALKRGEVPIEDRPLDSVELSGSGVDQKYQFNYLGDGKYRVEAIVIDENARVTVNGRSYKLRVSDEDVGETYVFMFDASDIDSPKLSSFKKQPSGDVSDTRVSDNTEPY